jgi:hypothetical protein
MVTFDDIKWRKQGHVMIMERRHVKLPSACNGRYEVDNNGMIINSNKLVERVMVWWA